MTTLEKTSLFSFVSSSELEMPFRRRCFFSKTSLNYESNTLRNDSLSLNCLDAHTQRLITQW